MEPIETKIQSKAISEKNVLILSKIIKWCLYILLALLPLWFLSITPNILDLDKQILMLGILTVALIAWLGKLLTQENVKWYKGLIAIFFLGFVIIYGLATVFSMQPYESLMGADRHLSRAFINLVFFFALFLLLVNYDYQQEGETKIVGILKFLTVFLASSLVVGVIGLLQVLGKFIFPWDFTKTTSFNTIGTLTSLGIFLAALLPVSISLLVGLTGKEKGSKPSLTGFKIFLGLLVIISLIIILLLNFRTLWIITGIGMIMTIGFWLSKRYALSGQALGWLAIPVVILAFCLIFFLFSPGSLFDVNVPAEIGLSNKAGTNIARSALQESPVLGTGPETFVYNYSLYKPKTINQTVFWNLRFTNSPNEVLSLFAEIGIIGLLSFLALIGMFLFKTVKDLIASKQDSARVTELKVGLFSSWIALALGWLFYPQSIVLMFTFWLLFSFLVVITSKQADIKTVDFKNSGKLAVIASFGFIIAVMIVIGLLYLGGSKFIAEVKYNSGIEQAQEGNIAASINKITRATVTNSYEDKYYRDLASLFLAQLNQKLNDQSLDEDERAEQIQLGISNTINSAARATTLNSSNVSNWINRGSVYHNLITLVNEAGKWAIQSYQEALKREPTNPLVPAQIAQVYVDMADSVTADSAEKKQTKAEYLSNAEQSYTIAIELKSNYAQAHFGIAMVYDRQGRAKEAITTLKAIKQSNPKDTGVIFQLGVIYYKAAQFENAKQEFKQAISLDPNYSNARYFLGLLYDKEGNQQAAIEQFEKITELNPDNKLVEQILANLKAGRPALGSPDLGPPQEPQEIPIQEGAESEEEKFKLPE